MSKKRLFQRLMTPLVLVLLLLVGGEQILRAVDFEYPPAGEQAEVWNPIEDRAIRSGTSFSQFDPMQLWAPKPGARLPWTKDERINAAGYRGPLLERAHKPGVMRILTLGSCAAFGRNVAYAETYSAALERHLREHGVQAEVLDGGVAGSTIEQGLERYREVFRGYAPDLVISSFCGCKEHEAAPRREGDRQRIKAWRQHPERSPCHEPGWSPRRDWRMYALSLWMLEVFGGSYWDESYIDFQERRARPLAEERDTKIARRVSLEEFRDALTALEREVRSDGGHLMLVNFPNSFSPGKRSPAVEMYGQELGQFSQRAGSLHVDGREVIQRAELAGTPATALFDASGFPSPRSNELLAQALAAEIIAHASELSH